MRPLVSVIVITYNHEHYIQDCLESILKQSYENWEAIIVDDHSTDKNLDRIRAIVSNDNRFITISHDKNWGVRGLINSYNQALSQAKGEFVAILEGDDYWPLDKIEKQICLFEDNEVILSFGQYITVTPNKEVISFNPLTRRSFHPYFKDYKGYLFKPMLLGGFILPVTVMIRTHSLRSIGGFQDIAAFPWVDYPTFLRLAMMGKFIGTSVPLGYYRKQTSTLALNRIVESALKHRAVAFEVLNNYGGSVLNCVEKDRIKNDMVLSHLCALVFAYWMEGRLFLVRGERIKSIRSFVSGIRVVPRRHLFHISVLFELMKLLLGLVAAIFMIDLEKVTNRIRNRRISIVQASR